MVLLRVSLMSQVDIGAKLSQIMAIAGVCMCVFICLFIFVCVCVSVCGVRPDFLTGVLPGRLKEDPEL